jgi:hypothetical protein|tara:strand:+ start:3399 stop:5600 length:2202 start_codon:yes stop_codon:yes gene_type:complete
MPEIHPEVKLTQDLFSNYSSARSDWAKQASEDAEFRAGKQWSDKQVKALRARAQEPLVVNVIHPAVEQAKAMLTANSPKFQSTGRDNSDTEVGRVFSDLMAWVWEISNGNTELKQSIDDYYVKGMGVMVAYIHPEADFGKGEVFIKSVDPLSVYFDADSQDPFCRDASNIIIAKRMTEKELIEIYPEFEENIKESSQTSHINEESENRFGLMKEDVLPKSRKQGMLDIEFERELEVFERYTKVKVPYYRVFDPLSNDEKLLTDPQYAEYREEPAVILTVSGGEQQIFTDQMNVSKFMAVHKEVGNVYHLELDPMTGQPTPVAGRENENSIPNSYTAIDPIVKGDLIDSEKIMVNKVMVTNIKQCISVGDEYLYSVTLPIEDYPIVPIMNNHHRNPYPISDVRTVRGLQEYINKLRSLIVAHASSSTNVKLLIPRGSMNKKQLEEEWGRAGTAVIEFDPELGQPIVAGPVPLPNELYKNEADAKSDIERILGIYTFMQGDVGSAPQTFKGTVALDEYGQRRIKSKKDDIEYSLNQLARSVVGLMQYVYTSEKVIRLMQPNNKPKEVRINQNIYDDISGHLMEKLNDISVGKYDIIIVSGSTLPSNRWARFEYYMQLYQSGLIDQIEVLKQTDVADMEGVLERAGQMQKLMQQVQQQEEQIKKLQGDLQTAQRESIHDRKRVEVKEFEKKLAKAEAKAEMATQLYKSRASDELAKLKEEVKEVTKSVDKKVGLKE